MKERGSDIAVEVIEKNQRKISAWLRVPPDYRFFEGHFPDEPIMPGVMHIYYALTLAGKAVGRPVKLMSVQRCKFTAPVGPGETIHADVFIRVEGRAEWIFTRWDRRTPVSKGVLTFDIDSPAEAK